MQQYRPMMMLAVASSRSPIARAVSVSALAIATSACSQPSKPEPARAPAPIVESQRQRPAPRPTPAIWSRWPDAARRRATFDRLPAGLVAELGYGRLRHRSTIYAIAWSRDSKVLASAGNRVRLWDAATGDLFMVLEPPQPAKGGDSFFEELAFSPRGRYLAIGGTDRVHVVDLQTLRWTKVPAVLQRGSSPKIAWSPDRKTIVVAGEDLGVWLWRPFDSAAPLQVTKPPQDVSIAAVAWSPRGDWIAVQHLDGYGWDPGNLVLHHVNASGRIDRRRSIRLRPAAQHLTWNRDGSLLAARTTVILVIPADESKKNYTITHDTDRATTTSFSPNGHAIASVGTNNRVAVTDVVTGRHLRSTRQRAEQIAWSPDGKRLATAASVAIQLLDAKTLAPADHGLRHLAELATMAVSSKGDRIAAFDTSGQMIVWDVNTRTGTRFAMSFGVADDTYTAAGTLLTTSLHLDATTALVSRRYNRAEEKEVIVWDLVGERIVARHRPNRWIGWPRLTKRGDIVGVNGTHDRIVTISKTGGVSSTGGKKFDLLAISHDGRFVVHRITGKKRWRAEVWDARLRNRRARLDIPDGVSDCAFSRDDRWVLCRSVSHVSVADARTGKRLAVIPTLSDPDGIAAHSGLGLVAIADRDRGCAIYRVSDGKLLGNKCRGRNGESIGASALIPLPKHRVGFATATMSGLLRIWDVTP